MNANLLTDPEITKRRHRAALNDLIDGARRSAAAAVVASNSAPDPWRAAVLEQTHEQLASIVERLQQLT